MGLNNDFTLHRSVNQIIPTVCIPYKLVIISSTFGSHIVSQKAKKKPSLIRFKQLKKFYLKIPIRFIILSLNSLLESVYEII